MKKIGLQLLGGVFVLLVITSCIGSGLDTPTVPTKAEKLAELSMYIDTLHGRGYDVDTTSLGVYYVVLEEGEGPFPESGDTLEVAYAGYFINGVLFDASDLYKENGTFKFILNDPPMIEGWDDGMKVINKGAKVQLIIPSDLAYGDEGYASIGPFETLVFVIEMKELKPVLTED